MRYVICHGALLPGQNFDRGSTGIGFYVNNLGELLPQSAATPIVRDQQPPTRTIAKQICPDLQLSPMTQYDWSAFTQALGPHATRPDVYLLPARTTLSALVAELNEDELRMICCTAVMGASREARSEEVLPGIMVDIPAVRRTDRPEDIAVQHNAGQLVFKREKSAAVAAAFIDGLGEHAAPLWAVNDLTYVIMAEHAIAQKSAITANADSWVDTIWYVMSPKGGPTTFTNPTRYPRFPDFGADARNRIQAINSHLAAWPGCVTQLAQIYGQDTRFDRLWRYLEDPATDEAVRTNARCYLKVILPVRQSAAALDPGNLDTWHAYALALRAVGPGDVEALPLAVDVNGTRQWLADRACSWSDFRASWTVVLDNFGDTIAPLLLDAGQHHEHLRDRIHSAQPSYVDGMDLAPESPLTTGPAQVQPSTPSLFCPHCARLVQHQSTDLATAEKTHQGVRVCAGCQAVIGPFDGLAAFTCTGCQNVAFAHTTCLRQ